jgi:enoyl-CoA hydratase
MENKEYQFLKFELEGTIGTLTLNREEKLNALSAEVIAELKCLLEDLSTKKLSGLIFTGAGEKAFIAGADIKAMTEMTDKEAEAFAFNGQHVSLMFEELRFPVIAAVNGFALGGGLEMALACDFIYATDNAIFGLPEVSLGLIPGFGGTQRLSRTIGRNRAKELIYTARKVKIEEAKNIGLVLQSFTSKAEMITAAKATLARVERNSPNAIGVSKFVINQGVDLTVTDGLNIEKEQFSLLFESFDMKEGTTAFLEKRAPQFKGE